MTPFPGPEIGAPSVTLIKLSATATGGTFFLMSHRRPPQLAQRDGAWAGYQWVYKGEEVLTGGLLGLMSTFSWRRWHCWCCFSPYSTSCMVCHSLAPLFHGPMTLRQRVAARGSMPYCPQGNFWHDFSGRGFGKLCLLWSSYLISQIQSMQRMFQ